MRAAVLDRRAQQVKNLYNAPSVERIGSNPGQIERFRNLFTNPQAKTNQAGYVPRWYGNGGNGTSTLQSGDTPVGNTFIRKTWTVVPTNAADVGWDLRAQNSSTLLSMLPGEVRNISAYFRASGSNVVVQGYTEFKNSSGTTIGSATFDAKVNVLTTDWQRVSFTTPVAPAGTTQVLTFPRVAKQTGLWAVGETLDIAGVCVTKAGTVVPYFDGDTPNNDVTAGLGLDYSTSWAGTAHASETVCTGPTPNQDVIINYCINPNVTVGSSANWGVSNGGASTFSGSVVTSGGLQDGSFWRSTVSATDGTMDGGFITPSSPIPSASAPYSSCIQIRSSRAIRASASYWWYGSTGNFLGSSGNVQVALAANTWTQVFLTNITPPAGATSVRVQVRNISGTGQGQWQVGDTFDGDQCCIAISNTQVEYFDGSYATGKWADADFMPFWGATPGASASAIRGVTPAILVKSSAAAAVQSFRNVASGKKSVRIFCIGPTSKDAYVDLLNMAGGGASLVEGKTYTAMARSYQEAVLVNPVNANYPRAMWVVMTGGTPSISKFSTAGSNVAGNITQHRITFKTEGANNYKSIRVTCGADIHGGEMWWDEFMLTEGAYTGPYIDGDKSNAKWLGTPHSSESVGYPKAA